MNKAPGIPYAVLVWAALYDTPPAERDPPGWARKIVGAATGWTAEADAAIKAAVAPEGKPEPDDPLWHPVFAWRGYIQRYGVGAVVSMVLGKGDARDGDIWDALTESARIETLNILCTLQTMSGRRWLPELSDEDLAALSFLCAPYGSDERPDGEPSGLWRSSFGPDRMISPETHRGRRRVLVSSGRLPEAIRTAADRLRSIVDVEAPPVGAEWVTTDNGFFRTAPIWRMEADGTISHRYLEPGPAPKPGWPALISWPDPRPGDAEWLSHVHAYHKFKDLPIPTRQTTSGPSPGQLRAPIPSSLPPIFSLHETINQQRADAEARLMLAGLASPTPSATLAPAGWWTSGEYAEVARPTERTGGARVTSVGAPVSASQTAPPPDAQASIPFPGAPAWMPPGMGAPIPVPLDGVPPLGGAPREVQSPEQVIEFELSEPSVIEVRADGYSVRAVGAPLDPYPGPVRIRVTTLVPAHVTVGDGILIRPTVRGA